MPDGSVVDVPPGGLVGRLPSAAVRLPDPRISEVHALVSLRGRELWLLAQRGLVEADGDRKADVCLRAGQRIVLVQGVELEVVDVVLPDSVLVVVGAGPKPVELSQPVYSLSLDDGVRLVPSWVRDAPLHLWADADGWWAQLQGEDEEPVGEGTLLEVGAVKLSVVVMPLDQLGTMATRSSDRIDPPLRIVARFDTVHIEQGDRAPAVIAGLGARIITELVDYAVPVPWEMVARAIYPELDDELHLRTNWDRTLRRLRAMLRRKGVRDNLVRADGKGNIELLLQARDEVVSDG
ncbi:MAG: FHA domain-containing protein [Alphaproteobacteria bacterium]|nr:FHA domain-containing protein [Alphaproteobacteria bacterium]